MTLLILNDFATCMKHCQIDGCKKLKCEIEREHTPADHRDPALRKSQLLRVDFVIICLFFLYFNNKIDFELLDHGYMGATF